MGQKRGMDMNYTYLLRCADDTLYCGYTNRLEARVKAHNEGKGAKYTRGRRPVVLEYYEVFQSKSEALRREAAIKKLGRNEKLALIRNGREIRTERGGQPMLEAGMKAPDFTLPDKDGNQITLSSFFGKGTRTVVYFYPKDSTPGCTKQACAFRDAYEEYRKLGVPVIGISKDSVKSHSNFAAKQELPFILASDPELTAIKAYDVWQEKKLYGKVSMGTVRTTYLIDENGIIEKVYLKVKPEQNAGEILEYLKGQEG